MRLPGEGKLIIVTGVPNHGKSTWLTHVMAHTAEKHDRRWAVFSPEFGEWQNLAAQIIAWRAAKPFRAVPGAGMTDCEIAEGSDWCGSRFAFLACDGESEAPTLDWLIERARACVLRDGTTDFVIDPWNEIEHDEGGRTETAYVGRALQRLRAFVGRHGCNVWIVAHPTKLKAFKPGEPVPVPTAYDIATSSNWANKADLIVTVHCPDTVTQIHLLKARFRRWGRRGAMAELEFDPTTGRFRSVAVTDAMRDAHCSRNQDD
jgi:twinkle protein